MQQVLVIHNPGAGDESHSKENILTLLNENGYQTAYLNTKEDDWKKFPTTADIILIAGGDGTVRKVARRLLNNQLLDKPNRLALLPLGTANNISTSLRLNSDIEHGIKSWNRNATKGFDVGRIFGTKSAAFFLESFGFGIFPYMMMKSEELPKDDSASLEDKLLKATKFLRQLAEQYKPVFCTIDIDDKKIEGNYLLVEVMNTPSIGPKLDISPASHPGDGHFELTLVPVEKRDELVQFLDAQIAGEKSEHCFETIRGRRITINWNGEDAHVDDQYIGWKAKEQAVIHLKEKLLEFLVPCD
jgi:diacylglycerol kinase (ATP)